MYQSDLDLPWPNFFIVGATRSGTTSLYEYLNHPPEVFMSSIKEPAFFSVSINRRKPIQNKEEYLKLFSKARIDQPIGEASTRYLIDPKSAAMIKDHVPKAKIIISLRDPVERAFSSYLYYLIREKKEPFNIIMEKSMKTDLNDDYLLYLVIKGGMYYEQVKRYIEIFGNDSVKIIFFEEFISDVRNQFKDILKFLGVESEPPEIVNTVFNEYKKPKNKISKFLLSFDDFVWKMGIKSVLPLPNRKNLESRFLKSAKKPIMSKEERLRLIDYYQDDVKKLRELLQRNLPWKNFHEI